MENLFKFATKELSQDAFLSWFIANCNEEEIRNHSYNFIKVLTGENLKIGDIKKIKISQQEHDIDIVVRIWTYSKLHYIIAIEDKTTSSAHSGQLKKYAKIIDGLKTDDAGYILRKFKVFYKVACLTEQDERELKAANEGYEEKDYWRVFTIDKIYKFFSKIQSIKSEILNAYVEHIKDIYNDLDTPSTEPIKEWNYNNFVTFFKKTIDNDFSGKGWDYHLESWQYQGRLVSVAFYYHPSKENNRLNKNVTDKYPCFAYPLVEFIFKKNSESILVYSHITYHWKEINNNGEVEKWDWKYSRYKPISDEPKAFMELLKLNLTKIPGVKVRKMNNEKDQTISVDHINLNLSNEDIKKEILDKLDMYFKVFQETDKQLI